MDVDINLQMWRLAQSIQGLLTASPSNYQFPDMHLFESNYEHECLSLELLRYHDHARHRANRDYSVMDPVPMNMTTTLYDLVRDTGAYAIPSHALREGRFVVQFRECRSSPP